MTGLRRRAIARALLALSTILTLAVCALAGRGVADASPAATATTPQSIPASRLANQVAIISVHGPIDDMTLRTLERRLHRAASEGCDAAVIELDTPGGELGATIAICHLLRTAAPANKVAWIRPQAFSAGAIIALACREIVVSPDSVMGDAAPVTGLPGVGMQPVPVTERAKLEAPVLSEVSESALRNGYDVRLVRAMVSAPDELWLVERDDGKRLFANAEEYEIVFGAPPRRGEGGYVPPNAPLALPEAGDLDLDERERELLIHAPRVTSAERGRWNLLGQVDTDRELVTLRGDQARLFGLASATVAGESELLEYFGASSVVRYDESWSEALVRFLISWPVRAILIVIMVLSLFVEMASPGFGLFGVAALIAFVVLMGAPMLAGLAQWWEVLLVVIGALLVAVELFLLPGIGVIGVVGAICMLVGLVFTFVGGDLSSPQSQSNLLVGLFATLGALVVAGVGLAVLGRHLPKMPLFRRLSLQATVGDAPVTLAVPLAPRVPRGAATGVTMTDLRPTGRARFGDAIVDVRTAGEWIDAGAPVRIAGEDGMGIIVERATQ